MKWQWNETWLAIARASDGDLSEKAKMCFVRAFDYCGGGDFDRNVLSTVVKKVV
jgi:hypothetical protein